jgi:hypothetical protein
MDGGYYKNEYKKRYVFLFSTSYLSQFDFPPLVRKL